MRNFIKIIENIENTSKFNNWVMPTITELEKEYDIEYIKKGLGMMLGEPWEDKNDFVEHALRSSIVRISPEEDSKIDYRSHTKSFDELHSLIKTYRSYGTFRSEETLKAIYDGFMDGNEMTLPIVLRYNNKRRVLSGNTRMDVAFRLGVPVKVLEIVL